MHSQRAASALDQYLEVSACLRGFDHSERVLLSRYLEIHRIIARDLEEDSRIRAAFVGLTGGVQEARTKSQAGRDAFLVAQRMPDLLQPPLVLVVHPNEGEQSEIISCAEAA